MVSKREVRDYAGRPLESTHLDRVLQAGRATGSSRNRQMWRFVAVTDAGVLKQLSELVAAPHNVATCAAAIAISMPSSAMGFDAGRVAQNMMVAAWNEGVGSCPNTVVDQLSALRLLGLPEDRHIATILSLGYPVRSWSPERSTAEQVLSRMDRLPLDELVVRI